MENANPNKGLPLAALLARQFTKKESPVVTPTTIAAEYIAKFGEPHHLPDSYVNEIIESNGFATDRILDAVYSAEMSLRPSAEQQEQWAAEQEFLESVATTQKPIEDMTDEEILEALKPDDSETVARNADRDVTGHDAFDVKKFGDEILGGLTFHLDDSQIAAVHGLVLNQYGCLIGAAGTGKTTTTRFLLNTFINGDREAGIEPLRFAPVDIGKYSASAREGKTGESKSEDKNANKTIIPSIALVAYTGQAVQVLKRNMPPSWRRNCMTIHSLLGYAPESYVDESGKEKWRFAPTYGKAMKMPWNVIIVDEASMVDVQLWHQILDACHPGTRIYFIGDLNQLTPPVGQGILGFALSKWPVFELTHVHRQKDEAANKIVDAAWQILRGEKPTFDDPTKDPNWRVIGMELKHDSKEAHTQIVALAKGLSSRRVSKAIDPAEPLIYDPFRDRIMTPMNGYNEDATGALVGQYPINESLAYVFGDPEKPRVVIDFKRGTKRFAEGYRVMALKNEPSNTIDRVTNGLTGRIVSIEPNPDWAGDWRLVGNENDVRKNRDQMVIDALAHKNDAAGQRTVDEAAAAAALESLDFSGVNLTQEKEAKQSGPSSHIVEIAYDNGAKRVYNLNAEIEQLQLAYASTIHKAQGAEMPTAIIVIHHASRRMLSREALYTAVTRASQRVIILYTDFGMRLALTNQKIFGKNLQEKVHQYRLMMGEGGDISRAFYRVRLSIEDEQGQVME